MLIRLRWRGRICKLIASRKLLELWRMVRVIVMPGMMECVEGSEVLKQKPKLLLIGPSSPDPLLELRPWTLLEDFRPQAPFFFAGQIITSLYYLKPHRL